MLADEDEVIVDAFSCTVW